MWIKTVRGWRLLQVVKSEVHQPLDVNDVYTGKFPSQRVCDAYNAIKEQLKYFDDGVRMVYGKPDKVVAVDNSIPLHPIS